MKFILSVLFSVTCLSLLNSASCQSVSSTEWEFQQILNSLIDRENRVKDLIGVILPKINSSYADLSPNGALVLTVAALKSLKETLSNLNTVSSYGQNMTTFTCNEVALRISSIGYDIQSCYQIKFQVDTNATIIFIQVNNLNAAYMANFYYLNDTQRQSLQSIITSLQLLIDEYNQYSLTLLMAIYKYVRLYIELIFCKRTYCSCPVQLSTNASNSLSIVDTNIKNIQASVDVFEEFIRNVSNDTKNKIAAINPDLKKNSMFILLTTSLDTIATLLNGYLLLTTTNIINSTLTCDDAALTVAFLEYKMELYFQAGIEAQKNATFVLYQLNSLNAYYAANLFYLTESQKQSLQLVMSSMNSLVEEFGQYIMTLIVAWVKLLANLIEAKIARFGSCNCTENTNGTIMTPSKFFNTKTSLLRNATKFGFKRQISKNYFIQVL